MQLLDHLIGPQQERLWNRETEGLGGLQVDHQLELRRLLDGKVGRLSALQYAIHVAGGQKVRSTSPQATAWCVVGAVDRALYELLNLDV
jgi:hypothetical protein